MPLWCGEGVDMLLFPLVEPPMGGGGGSTAPTIAGLAVGAAVDIPSQSWSPPKGTVQRWAGG